jgi:cell division protein FtsI (penicillin-binding protein 3)
MNKYKKNQSRDIRSRKLLLLFVIIALAIGIFLNRVYSIISEDRNLPPSTSQIKERAKRGSIISADNYTLSYSKKIYKATINTSSIYPDKLELFIELFSIYSKIDRDIIKGELFDKNGKLISGRVTISRNISAKRAIHLKSLAYKLKRLKVFRLIKNSKGVDIMYGLDVIENGEARNFPLNDILTPTLGYTRKDNQSKYTRLQGMKGLEKYYNDFLKSKRDGYLIGKRDVAGYVSYGDYSIKKDLVDGLDIHLNIPLNLQSRVEKVLDNMKESIDADEIIASVMESKTGKILSLASSERFNPNKITQDKIYALNPKFTEYLYEPGSVLKPITLAIVMDRGKVKPNTWFQTYNGKLRIGKRYVIRDDEKFKSLSATGIIVHSSNVGISQIVWKITGGEFYEGLRKFGLAQKTGIDLSRELSGKIKGIHRLNHKLHRANSSYGYGMLTTFMQIFKAYSSFNNDGLAMTPQIIDYMKDNQTDEYYKLEPPIENLQTTSKKSANAIKNILKMVVKKGTGIAAQYKGLEIGGKTGTAHMSQKGIYIKKYNSSFFGFANDDDGHKYTIGVLVIDAKKPYKYFASASAVPTFKKIVKQMVGLGYLKVSTK